MATIKNKLKAGESVSGKLVSVDCENNKITMTEKDDKEVIVTTNSITAEWVEVQHETGDLLKIGFDGEDYDVDEIETL